MSYSLKLWTNPQQLVKGGSKLCDVINELTFSGVEQIFWLKISVCDVHVVKKFGGNANVFH